MKIRKDKQSTYNVSLWRVPATIVFVEKQYVLHIVCVCSLRPRHIFFCGLLRSTIFFSTLTHKWHDFRNKVLNIKCVFRLSLQPLSEIFLILRRNWGDLIKHVYCS